MKYHCFLTEAFWNPHFFGVNLQTWEGHRGSCFFAGKFLTSKPHYQGSFMFWHFSGVEAETLTGQKFLKKVPVDFKIYTHYSGANKNLTKNWLPLWIYPPQDASVTTRMTLYRFKYILPEKHFVQGFSEDCWRIISCISIHNIPRINRFNRYPFNTYRFNLSVFNFGNWFDEGSQVGGGSKELHFNPDLRKKSNLHFCSKLN